MKNVLFDMHPSEKQAEFLLSKAKYTAYGGARGGGKSWALRYKLLLLCLRYAGIRTVIIRRTFPELRENHARALYELAVKTGLATYSETHKVFEFINGSVIKLGYLDSESDLLQYQGQEFDIIALDEATQLHERAFAVLAACLRGANDFPKRMYLTCNPGGVGHGWVKRLFIDRNFREGECPEDYRFIPALVYDNQALMSANPDYVRQLEMLPDELKRAWLYGEWDVFAGQFFTEFDEHVHAADIVLPKRAERYCTLDYGLDMLAALFIAVDEDGRAYVYDEIYESGLIVSEAAKKIRAKSTEEMLFIAPADLWSRQKDSGKSIAELFAEGGVYLTKITPNRVSGWLALKEWLKKDENGRAMLTIDRKCKNILRTLPLLMHDPHRQGDAATEPHEITHAPDALRYFASFRTCAAKREEAKTFMRGKMKNF
ncbi:MAG: phage terminase large subunit [Clostridia bacterium]|nr:phage terminase large subunit [Clostridia bacterium]